jgi:hypothetical protein
MHEHEAETKAAPEESSASWSALLADLVRSFILLRDFFGYVLPGAFFLLIGAYFYPAVAVDALSKHPGIKDHLWLFILLLVGISYLLGHFIIATSYLSQDLLALTKVLIRKLKGNEPEPTTDAQKQEKKEKTEKAEKHKQEWVDFLRYHKQFPEIFVEFDRQSILALLRRGLAASLFLGILVFRYLSTHPLRIMVAAGVIMVLNIFANRFHIQELWDTTLKAAKEAATAHLRRNF